MTVPFTELRDIMVQSRTAVGAGGPPLWTAQLVVGLLNRLDAQDNPKGPSGDLFRLAVRVVAQDSSAAAITVNTVPRPGYHAPRLIQAAVRAKAPIDGGGQPGSLSVNGIAKAGLNPTLGSSAVAAYSDVLLGLNDTIATKHDIEIELPEVTLESGAIATLLRVDSGDLGKWLGIPSASPNRIFGATSTIAITTIANAGGHYLQVWLVPEGIEFVASLPDPFAVSGPAPAAREYRLLLTYDADLSQFMLRPRLAGSVRGASEALRKSFDDIMWRFGGSGTPLLAEVDPKGLPFAWALGPGAAGRPLDATKWQTHIDAAAIRVRLNSEAPGGSAVPTVCQLKVRSAWIATADRTLTINCDSSADVPDLADAAAPADSLVTATVTWSNTAPGTATISAGKTAPQVIDTGAFEQRLRKRYDAAGLQVDSRKALYVFLPLERGMVQAPLPEPPSSDEKKLLPPDGVKRSAFSGLIRCNLPMGDYRDAAPVEVTAAISAKIVVKLAGTPLIASTTATFAGARGRATGLVFAAAASPSPSEILPPLDAGPIACEPLDIVFGEPQLSSTLSVRSFDIAMVLGRPARLSVAISLEATAGDAIVWRAHPRMALVSTMPMTRTRFDASRPSATRDLVPFTVASGTKREFVLITVLDDPNRSPFPDLAALPTVAIDHDPVWPWPDGNLDNAAVGEANDAIANVSASVLTLPGIEMTLDGADWGDLKASLRYDLPVLGELFAGATLPKAPARGSPRPDDVPEHAPTALEPAALSAHWTLTANRHGLSRTINDRTTDWFAMGAAVSTKPITTFVEPYSFNPSFTVAMDSAGLPLGAYGLFGKNVAGSSALAGWSDKIVSEQGFAFEIVGFSARLYTGAVGGNPAQIDTRGVGQACLPRPQQGLVELRDITRLDLDSGTVLSTDRVALTAAHIGFSVAGIDCGLRLRDLPMTADGRGNLSFAPTTVTADRSRALTGPEGDVGPDGSVFERQQLQDAVFEWSFYTAEAGDLPSFLCRLSGIDLRPLRLTSVSFANEVGGLRLSGFEIIANVEPSTVRPLTPIDGGGPITDDDPYRTGNPIAFTFAVAAIGGVASLVAVHPVSVKDRTILIGAATQAAVSFPASARLIYGAAETGPSDGVSAGTHNSLPIVLEMTLQASGDSKRPLAIGSAAMRAMLFGSPTRVPFDPPPLPDGDTLVFTYRPAAGPPSILNVACVMLSWRRELGPTLKLCARVRLPGAVTTEAAPAGSTRNLVDWQIGATLRWFGTTLAHDDTFNFDADHDKGTLTLSTIVGSLPPSAAFIQGWSVAGAPLTLALAMAFASFKAPALFPADPSAGFVEVTCGTAGGTFIRHRSIAPSSIETRTSRILVSLPSRELSSAIAWPINGLSATFPAPDGFAPHPRRASEWRQEVKVDGTNAHAHAVNLVIRDAELSALNLFERGGSVTLGAPWTFPALATHRLTSVSDSVTWTSLDEVVVGHLATLEQEAAQALGSPPGDLAFAARYMGSLSAGQAAFAVSAGVFSKAMARAGIPTLELLASLRLAEKVRDATGSGGTAPAASSDLFISGAALVEVTMDDEDTLGHRVVTPWIAPLFEVKALGVLGAIPQAPWTGQVSSYDLAPYCATRLDRESLIPFATTTASVSWIKKYRERIAAALPDRQVPRFEPISQAIIADADPANNDPAYWLSRPIWLRTLAAWKAILLPGATRPLANRMVTVIPIMIGDAKVSLRATTMRLVAQRSVDDEPAGANTVAALDLSGRAGITFEVIVLTRDAITVIPVANDDAKILESSQQAPNGEERARLARLSLSVPDEPLVAAVGELTDVPAELLSDDEVRARTHRICGFLELPTYLDAVREPHPLRDRSRTVFSSAGLAWPRAAVRSRWNNVDQPAALALGDQRPLQDPAFAWAGDVRSFSVTGVAAAPDITAPFRAASVLMIGQRALFRRPTDEDLTAPSDRALTPVPSRARVPSAHTVELGLQSQRLRTADTTPEAAIAAIQPGHFEIVTTGRRPGVLFFQYDGLSFADGEQSFDARQPRFGRPADRGPVAFRQTRAPRSTVYPITDVLAQRRQTFIGSDFHRGAAGELLPFALANGPMTALRILTDATLVETILLRLAGTNASAAAISSAWDGNLELTATLYETNFQTAKNKLIEVGLIASDASAADPTARGASIALAIASNRLGFPQPVVGVATPNPFLAPSDAKTAFDVPILLSLSEVDTALVRSVLQSADADSRANLIISLPVPGVSASCDDPKTGDGSDLPPGPPRLLAIPVPIAAGRGPSLHIGTATLAFGDPAYDREISSKTASASQQIGDKFYLLALDRTEYDPPSSISFAAGAVTRTILQTLPGRDPIWEAGEPKQMTLQLGVLRKSTPGIIEESPLVIKGCSTSKAEPKPRHRICAGQPYTIALADLLEAIPNKKSDWTAGYSLQALSPALVDGDRVVVTANWSGRAMSVAVTIVADPVMSPPAAIYGLATLDQDLDTAKRLTSSLFATGPLPQIVEFQDLAGDLAKGQVRRRAVFIWPFCPRTTPATGIPYAALIKVDRTGGGQLPDSEADFQPMLK